MTKLLAAKKLNCDKTVDIFVIGRSIDDHLKIANE
ncbi:MAG: hypothetical protein ACJASU_000073 [Cognaticolwellia sp.]|jgi:hypothetical protein